jgi:NitT/TauT family transport system ATP-binding protein
MRAAALSEASLGPAAGATDGPSSAAQHIKAVRKFYDELEAIRNVSFEVAGGEFLSLLGPSGCGKSTLLMMVAGLIDATEGEISINGNAVSGPRREVGVVFQQPVLLPWRKVR